MSEDLFHVVSSGAAKIPIHSRVPLGQVADAHRRLEARKTTGATVLLPEDGRLPPGSYRRHLSLA